MAKQAKEIEKSVFISHRHIDKAIADVFRETMKEWSEQRLSVYQSSNAEDGSAIASDLDDAIAGAIADSGLVLLIYTHAPGDMDWCMFECGLAQDPRRKRETRVAVFHTTQSPPDPLDGLISMRLEEESVRSFTHSFHKRDDFIPGHGEAIDAGICEEELESRSRTLFKALNKVAPERPREKTVYDRISVGLSFSAAQKLCQMQKDQPLQAVYDFAAEHLPSQLTITSTCGRPEAHFNFSELEDDVCFGELVDRWRQDSDFSKGNLWSEGVYEAITRAILKRPEREVAFPFNSLDSEGDNWLLPLLARYRTMPFEKMYEFDILFCRLDPDTALRMIASA